MHVIEVPILFLSVCTWLFITQRWAPEKLRWPGVDNVSRLSSCQWEMQVLITFETMAIISRLKCLRGNTRITCDFKEEMQTTF